MITVLQFYQRKLISLFSRTLKRRRNNMTKELKQSKKNNKDEYNIVVDSKCKNKKKGDDNSVTTS